jgi:transcriptional regulator NrdR family protein
MTSWAIELRVVKNDGTKEQYIHTKVVGTIANALSAAGQPDIKAAEEIAEAVTFFLYKTSARKEISTGEILSIIETALADTGFEAAAAALSEHHFERKLRRSRIEVTGPDASETVSRWDKSRIVEDLVFKRGLPRQTARTIASMVEEKVFNMGVLRVSADVVKQLVISDAAALIHAQQQLQM